MLAGHFSENHESSGDLNRSPESRGSQTSGVLPVLFVQAKRIKLFPFGKFRGSANLDSARRNGGFAQTKLKPSKKKIRGSANLAHAFRFSRSRKSASVLRFTSKLKSTNANKVQTFVHKAGRQIKNSLGGKTEKPQRLSFLCFIRKFSAH